ncbi:hypothetical protein A3860_30940 [Niastella vici]|uniref:Gylcosyl hydrolase 115 C-terminal domain-containing protein n=1 Tax=Niastella vici TaxID=1703345 RepID=A0A1V9FUB3_9BACT|nr:glycosyl hydrolase 115 family protein [Niastella vici]OQP61898.1 hypothetical protein A3860_30940 [Niastella vici]
MNIADRSSLFLFLLLLFASAGSAQDFSFTDKEKGLQILYSPQGSKLDSVAAHLLANDIKLATGSLPPVITDKAQAAGNVIIIGNIASAFIQQFTGNSSSMVNSLKGKWECYGMKAIDKPDNKIAKALVVAGSDMRGTAYGVFSLSEKLGVSPWYWWADVPVKQQKELIIQQPEFIAEPPGVKYRGIFINDEDWGLQPWAAKTFEPETGDIGPKTYAKVFELLLRLKANLIWPAMHPSTKAFFSYPENVKVAEAYGIVIGSSHAEPMLRNNVGEWDEKTMGPFNYITNKEKVSQYWESRVKESTGIDAIYSMGMRGVHDSGMEGVKNAKEAVPLLEQIIKDQRGLLEKYRGKKADSIPQAFTAYKEVLDIYDNGLKIPDDITLVWPDDNYGYIQRLNNEAEKARSGGSGVYYHASYWGRPHDYLWLNSTHPGLMREEMIKAFKTGADKIWILNVGDIKPLEYNIGLFLDMAYDPTRFREDSSVKPYLDHWLTALSGKDQAQGIGDVLWQYYQLAFERRPEFMGWSRTEPTTQTTTTRYNHFYYGDEAQRRIEQYEELEMKVKALRLKITGEQAAAYYQLVYYPVMCASWMNKKFLYRDKAIFYAKQNRLSAREYAERSKAMYDSIVKETDYYNNGLAGGKWKNIMSMKPRNLPVYREPVIPEITIDGSAGWSIAPEGFVTKDSSLPGVTNAMALPAFDNLNQQRYFIDVFLNDKKPVTWRATPSQNWIRLSYSNGSLSANPGKSQVRIWVTIDWDKAPVGEKLSGNIIFKAGSKEVKVEVPGRQLLKPVAGNTNEYIENNGYVSLFAADYTRKQNKKGSCNWAYISDLGYTGKTLQALPISIKSESLVTDPEVLKRDHSCVEYDFNTFTATKPEVHVFTLPTHPLNNSCSMRYAVSIDDGPLTVVDFKTIGRSEEWKNNVLSNRAERTIQLPYLQNGRHTLKVYCIDPGVILDEISIDLGGLMKSYSTIPETKPAPMQGVPSH